MTETRWGVLVVNLGSPASADTPAVRRYLREFLSDPKVLDWSAPARWLLVNFIICPFRSPRSAEAYRRIWTPEGSPLVVHGRAFADDLGERMAPVPVRLAMRYGEPSVTGALAELQASGAEVVAVLPLFPQFAEASWGSVVDHVRLMAAARDPALELAVVPPFFAHEAFIDAVAAVSAPVLAEAGAERLLLSFHGLPERQVLNADTSGSHCLASADCCATLGERNATCYRAQCFATARALAGALKLDPESWEVTFQSRLGRTPWIGPHTDARVAELAAEGVKRVAVVCPAFVADCLETLEEIGIGLREAFIAAGGEHLELVPCVNAHPAWVEGAARLIQEAMSLGSTHYA